MRRALLLPLVLAACAAAQTARPADVPQERGSGKACNAARAQRLVGRARGATVAREAMRLTGAGAIRWIRPNSMVTMDYRPDRLNLYVGKNGHILRLTCG